VFLGIYYRPATLKSLTMLMGNTERRTVYKNFEVLNLHTNAHDFSHKNYERYLKNAHFIGPEETNYWVHTVSNILPTDPPPTDREKGLFNVFPLDLTSESLKKNASAGSSLGKLLSVAAAVITATAVITLHL
jgi:hypothetical protein